jgi:hypothetical protein
MNMYKTIFAIDGIAQAYIGYTSGRLWKGWATPYFEVAEALEIMEEYNKLNTKEPMHYDERLDRFVVIDSDGIQYEPLESWKGNNIKTDDGIKHLYGIGAYCWIWDAVTDGDRRGFAQQIEEFIYFHDTYNYWDEYDLKRDEVVESIIKQFQDLNTFHKAICIMRREDLKAEEILEALGKILTI